MKFTNPTPWECLFLWTTGWSVQFMIISGFTVQQGIADPRLNFELFCDWLKVGHVVWLLVCDWIIPPPILSSEGQLLFGVLYTFRVNEDVYGSKIYMKQSLNQWMNFIEVQVFGSGPFKRGWTLKSKVWSESTEIIDSTNFSKTNSWKTRFNKYWDSYISKY
jgi:hypothetical protein